VPVDAQGDVQRSFLEAMLRPSAPVNTQLLDNNAPSGLSRFALVGLRLMGHDLYDGKINGDVTLRTLFAPEQSGNTAFTRSQQSIDMVKEWGRRDLTDDGVINGSAFGQLIEDTWPTTDNARVPGFARGLRHDAANLNAAELFRTTPNVETADGVRQWAQQTGFSPNDLLNFSLWGHLIMDRANTGQQIARDALNNRSAIDFSLANFSPETRAFTQRLTTDPDADHTIGLAVLNFLNRAV